MVTPPWADPGRGLFPISVAAELTGLHPHTLRLYDQQGLLSRPAARAGPAATAPMTSTACTRS
jgi:MerR-like DNA binding protein